MPTPQRSAALFAEMARLAAARGDGEETGAARRWTGLGLFEAVEGPVMWPELGLLVPPRCEPLRAGHFASHPPPPLHVPPEPVALESLLTRAGVDSTSIQADDEAIRLSLAPLFDESKLLCDRSKLQRLQVPVVPAFVKTARDAAAEDALVGLWSSLRRRQAMLACRPRSTDSQAARDDWAFGDFDESGLPLALERSVISAATGRAWDLDAVEAVTPLTGSELVIVDGDFVLPGLLADSTLAAVLDAQRRVRSAAAVVVSVRKARFAQSAALLWQAVRAIALTRSTEADRRSMKFGDAWPSLFRPHVEATLMRLCISRGQPGDASLSDGLPGPSLSASSAFSGAIAALNEIEARPGVPHNSLAGMSAVAALQTGSRAEFQLDRAIASACASIAAFNKESWCGVTDREAGQHLAALPTGLSLDQLMVLPLPRGGPTLLAIGRGAGGAGPDAARNGSSDEWPWNLPLGVFTLMPRDTLAEVEALLHASATQLTWAVEYHRAVTMSARLAAEAADRVRSAREASRLAELETRLAGAASAEECSQLAEQEAARVDAERAAETGSEANPSFVGKELLGREADGFPPAHDTESTGSSALGAPLVALRDMSRKRLGEDVLSHPAVVLCRSAQSGWLEPDESVFARVEEALVRLRDLSRETQQLERRGLTLAQRVANMREMQAKSGDMASSTSHGTAGASDLTCCITKDVIRDCVLCPECLTPFERDALLQWLEVLRRGHRPASCPQCKVAMRNPQEVAAVSGQEEGLLRLWEDQCPILAIAAPAKSVKPFKVARPFAGSSSVGRNGNVGMVEPGTEVLSRQAGIGPASTAFVNEQLARRAPAACGTKLRVVMSRLVLLPPSHKALVFSQEARVLELLRALLDQSGFTCEVFRGKAKGTQAVIDRFQRPIQDADGDSAGARSQSLLTSQVAAASARQRSIGHQSPRALRGLLLNFRTDASGLTLHAANHVFLMEPYAPEDERQAISRAHRLGQTRTVHVYRVTMAGSVEESLLAEREALTGGEPPADLRRAAASRAVRGLIGASDETTATGMSSKANTTLQSHPVAWQELLIASVQRVARETRGEAVSGAWAEAAAIAETAPAGSSASQVSPASPRRRGKRSRSLPRRNPRPRVLAQAGDDDDDDDEDERVDAARNGCA